MWFSVGEFMYIISPERSTDHTRMISICTFERSKVPKTAGRVICFGGLKGTLCDVDTPPSASGVLPSRGDY